jgi:spore coat protein U-like protein
MKKIALAAALGLMALSSQAATIGGAFNVSVTLTAKCRVSTVGTPNLAFGTYTAFAGAVPATPIVIDFECTRGFGAAPTVEFDTGTDKASSAAGATATGAGVVGGLNYTIAVTAGALTGGAAATTAFIGTPDTYGYTISGNMPAGQAGDVTKATTQARTLTITY